MASVPVTIITGFLGAGKTTLLNHILTAQHGRKIAVIENEYGEVGIDHELVVQSDEEIFEMNNGCLCCTVRGDLIRILGTLLKRKQKFDAVIIETTGLADPGPVIQTFLMDEELKPQLHVDAVVTVVDAKHVLLHLDSSEECRKQVAFADIILLNKTDLVSEPELASLERRLREINRVVKIHRTRNSLIDLGKVIGVGAFDLGKALDVDPSLLNEETPYEWGGIYKLEAGDYRFVIGEAHGHHHPHHEGCGHDHAPGEECHHGDPDHEKHDHDHDHGHEGHGDHGGHGHNHDQSIAFFPVAKADHDALHAAEHEAGDLFAEKPTFVAAGEALKPGKELVRLAVGCDGGAFPVTIAKAGAYALFAERDPAETGGRLERDGKPVAPAEGHAFAGHHHHESDVSSVGIDVPGELKLEPFQKWIGALLRDKGQDIYRFKGIVSIAGQPNEFVFQGIHMLFDGKPGKPWGERERRNKLVFIGKDLDREALTGGVLASISK